MAFWLQLGLINHLQEYAGFLSTLYTINYMYYNLKRARKMDAQNNTQLLEK